MRKIFFTLTIVPFLFVSSLAQAEYEGVTVGLSYGTFAAYAEGKETVDGTSATTEGDGAFEDDTGSIFIEADLGNIALGVDYMFEGAVSPENTNAVRGSTNTAKVEIEELVNIYATIDVYAGIYVKAGYAHGSIKSLEVVTTNSQTGGTVGDQDIEGMTIGLGIKHELDNGLQLRAELNVSEYDNFSVTDDSGDKYDFKEIYSGRAIIGLAKTF